MGHFYVWRLDKWKYVGVLFLITFVLGILLYTTQGKLLFVFSNQETAVLVKGNDQESDIALTFNISWGEERAHHILEELKNHQVRATFFVSGEWAERHPDIVKKIVEDEHEVGMLGYRYKSYIEQDITQVRKDLNYAKDIFKKLELPDINLLRTPNGHFNEEVIDLAEKLDLKVAHWNVNPHDWKNPGVDKIVDTVMKETSNGDIILLHASDSVKQTRDALKTILPGLKNKGFTFVTISEMMNQAKAKAKLVE
ncbi:polysaccharide deacetylase family sporulation protein PdaB [Cerasibacillus quisquiliarum]|uniref:Putative polysaccharide deacetylase PdaB n=1 Tax=Cerasibacillus quisquiliarum TaxID=227865 RepID=A0A511V5H3_9BACI|nr:polysaccharide deacetylase family sporulation protein PdaB [Cerasibacillus quisquiliarum]MBB5147381.1 polysaccharide deacetylase family sporulation protein PdaB [Cerasibacillus quisquiliarum]GEN32442.1 putative polysaccharide deacetylase PdaB [Cerasibacillus quisquiliarum]